MPGPCTNPAQPTRGLQCAANVANQNHAAALARHCRRHLSQEVGVGLGAGHTKEGEADTAGNLGGAPACGVLGGGGNSQLGRPQGSARPTPPAAAATPLSRSHALLRRRRTLDRLVELAVHGSRQAATGKLVGGADIHDRGALAGGRLSLVKARKGDTILLQSLADQLPGLWTRA